MAQGRIELIGNDIRMSGQGLPEVRVPLADAEARLADWAKRYDRAAGSDNEAELAAIGTEIYRFLEDAGFAASWAAATGDRELDIAVENNANPAGFALLDAPWELLADPKTGPLAANDLQPFVVLRQIGPRSTPAAPRFRDVRLMFMAAAPEGQSVLDFEGEEAAILEATAKNTALTVVVEETGALEFLQGRLSSNEGPFEVLHLSCHGDIDKVRGPVLCLEDEIGEAKLATPAHLVAALPAGNRPLLVSVSACRTAESGGSLGAAIADRRVGSALQVTASYARQLTMQVANVLAWDGSVYDADAIAFAAEFYARLSLGDTVPRAAAMARLALWQLRKQSQDKGRHWHLARVYLGAGGGGALRAPNLPRHARLPDAGDDIWLDKRQKRIPVAPREAFVGRRRSIQRVLRAFREGQGLAAAVLVHGMGALGKSSLAARIASRVGRRETIVIFGRYDALTIFDAVLEAVPPAQRSALRDLWRPLIDRQHRELANALEDLLENALAETPILLIVDDLERVLEPPGPEKPLPTVLDEGDRVALTALLRAFDKAQTESRLLITCRYPFTLPDGRGGNLASRITSEHLAPMDKGERLKQVRATARVLTVDLGSTSDHARALLDRAVQAAGGNPGLQDVLTRPVLTGEITVAETALAAIEHYQRTGVPPAEIQKLIDAGTAKDSDNALTAFFGRLAFETYRSALTRDEALQLSAATLFEEAVPIPLSALAAVGAALGAENAEQAVTRLLALGLLDDLGTFNDHREAAANPLARPLAASLVSADLPRLATAAFAALDMAWVDADGAFPVDPRGIEATRLGLVGTAPPTRLELAASAGVAWLAQRMQRKPEAVELFKSALEALPVDHPADPQFLRLGLECAGATGDGALADRLLDHPVRAALTDVLDTDHAAFDLRRAERLMRRGSPAAAEPLVLAARKVFTAARNDRLAAIAAGTLADILEHRGEVDEALRIRREDQLPVFERTGDVRSRAVTMGKIANTLWIRGDLDEALRLLVDEQLPVFDRLGDVRERALTMSLIADVFHARGDLNEALRIRQEDVLPVLDRLGDIRSRAVTMGRIAEILQARGELDEALRIRRQDQLPVYDRLGDVRSRAVTLQKIADALIESGGIMSGRLPEIVEVLAEAFAIVRQLRIPDGIAGVSPMLAQVLALGGQRAKALAVLDEAEQAFAFLKDAEGLAFVQQLRAKITALPPPPAPEPPA